MSSRLKAILQDVVAEEYQKKRTEIEEHLDRYLSLLVTILERKKFHLRVWVGGDRTYWEKEKDLVLLEKAKLIEGKMHYTDHTACRVYTLTPNGLELANLLTKPSKPVPSMTPQ